FARLIAHIPMTGLIARSPVGASLIVTRMLAEVFASAPIAAARIFRLACGVVERNYRPSATRVFKRCGELRVSRDLWRPGLWLRRDWRHGRHDGGRPSLNRS